MDNMRRHERNDYWPVTFQTFRTSVNCARPSGFYYISSRDWVKTRRQLFIRTRFTYFFFENSVSHAQSPIALRIVCYYVISTSCKNRPILSEIKKKKKPPDFFHTDYVQLLPPKTSIVCFTRLITTYARLKVNELVSTVSYFYAYLRRIIDIDIFFYNFEYWTL